MALIRRYSVQVDGLSGWYDVTDAMPRTEALAALKAMRAESKRMRRGQTFRLHELASVRRKVANPSCKCSGRKVANPRGTPKDAAERWTIRREPLNSGGYTSSGEYFGRGAPLFVYAGELPGYGVDWNGVPRVRDIYEHVRASDRASAIAKVLQKYPTAKFYGVKKVANPARKRKPAAKRAPSRRKAR